jgi:hypothetical protein
MSKPFEGLKIYYSGSIYGTPESDPEFAWKLVQYMAQNGANVLSEHVAARNKQEMDEIRTRRSGITLQEFQKNPEPWFMVRRQDIKWVDEATHLVALVNSPSHGVGMEIQRAIDKPKLGMSETPILCLIHSELFSKLSFMIRGVTSEESSIFQIKEYRNLQQAQQYIHDFLSIRK